MSSRNHWHSWERPDLSVWVKLQSDMGFSERLRLRIEYLNWLYRAVAWERLKEVFYG
jgi:hypothetical protein